MRENSFLLSEKDDVHGPDVDRLGKDYYNVLVAARDSAKLSAYFKDSNDIKAFGFFGDKCTGFDVVLQEYDGKKHPFLVGQKEPKLVVKTSNGQRVLEYEDFINLVKLNNMRVEGIQSIKNFPSMIKNALIGNNKKG